MHGLQLEEHWTSRPYTKKKQNLSTTKLLKTKAEVLHLGLKFTTAITKGDTINTIVKNHKMKDIDFDKGFIPGIITVTMRSGEETIILWNFVKSFKKLLKNKNIIITTYNEKLECLLSDPNIYEKVQEHNISNEVQKIYQKFSH